MVNGGGEITMGLLWDNTYITIQYNIGYGIEGSPCWYYHEGLNCRHDDRQFGINDAQ